jgi:serine/threonine-protein kinase
VLGGTRPFNASSERDLIELVVSSEAPSLESVAPEVPRTLADIAARALARDPAQRFTTAGEMADALERYATSTGESLGQAALARELKALFGEVRSASELITPALPAVGPATETLNQRTPRTPSDQLTDVSVMTIEGFRSRWRWPVALVGLAVVVIGAVVGSMLPGRTTAVRSSLSSTQPETDAATVAAATRDTGGSSNQLAQSVPPGDGREVGVAVPLEAQSARVDTATPADAGAGVKVARKSGRVLLLVKPWAEVFLNGRSLGVTPMDPVTLPPGSHTLVLKNQPMGVERRVVVKVRPGVQSVVRVILE